MSDMVKQALSLIRDSATNTIKNDYGKNVYALYTDAKKIKSSIQDDTAEFAEKFKVMRTSGVYKKFGEWFRNGESEALNDADENDDDFDMGDEAKADSGNEATIDSINNYSKQQIATMFKIGGKQAEVDLANTARLVTTLDNRAAEITTAINGLNTSVNAISTKLDKLITVNSVIMQGREYKSGTSINDSEGNISIANLFQKMKETNTVTNNMAVAMMKMMGTALSAGPGAAVDIGLSFLGDAKFKAFGGKSMNDIGESFAQASGAVIQNTLSEVINKDFIKKIIGDVTEREADTDYGKIVKNQYNTDKALFDGMTRKSIVDIIPGYLKEMTQLLGGNKLNIDDRGHLTTKESSVDMFSNKVLTDAFSNAGMDYSSISKLNNQINSYGGADVTSEDISNASKALTMVYVLYLHKHGVTNLRASQIDPHNLSVINQAVDTLVYSSNKSKGFWERVCENILISLAGNPINASKFVSNVNKQLQNMINSALELSQSTKYGEQSRRITYEDTREAFKNYMNDGKTTSASAAPIPNIVNSVSAVHQTTASTSDYTKGIFDILNRGINVRVTGKKAYKPFTVTGTVTDNTDEETVTKPSDTTNENDVSISESQSGYLSSMFDSLIPKSIRLNMQHFANKLDPSDNSSETGVEDERITKILSRILKGGKTVVDKGLGVLSPITDKFKPVKEPIKDIINNIKGSDTVDADGNTVSNPGILKNTKNIIDGKITDIKDTFSNKIDDMRVKSNYNKMRNDINKLNVTEGSVDEDDKIKAQEVFSLMQAAMADGDGTADVSDVTKAINKISNTKLKARLQASVIPMLNKSNQAKAEPSTKSGIGKYVGLAVAGIGKFLTPIKGVLSTMVLGLKTFSKKLFSIVGKLMYSGAVDVGVGAKSMASGMTDMVKTLAVKPIMEVAKFTKNSLSSVAKATAAFYKKAGGAIANVGKKLATKFSGMVTTIKDKFSKVTGFFKNSGAKVPDAVSNIGAKFAESSFGKNFLGVFKQAQEKKQLAKISKAETMADEKANAMEKMLSGSTNSVFTTIIDLVKEIKDKYTKEEEPVADEVDAPSAANSDANEAEETQDTSQATPTTTPKPTVTSATPSDTSSSTDIDIPSTDTSTSPITDLGSSGTPSVDTAGAASGGGIKGKLKGIGSSVMGSLGKMAGGMLSILGGISKMVLGIVMGMAGFKAIMELVKTVLTNSLEPLNKMFFSVLKVVKPIIKSLGAILKTVVESVTVIAESVIDVIQPLLEAIKPLLDIIMETLKPILELVAGLVKVILAPLMGIIQHIVVPILRAVGNTLEILLGTVEVGMGLVLTSLGAILTGIGAIVGLLGGGKKLKDTGKNMLNMGTSMVSNGISSIGSGIKNSLSLASDMLFGTTEEEEEEPTQRIKPETAPAVVSGGSIMDGIMPTAGPTEMNITGSGDAQGSFGNYMNMGTRGCGPVALADMFARRTGQRVDTSSLAAGMSRNGAYDPNRGTSVGGYIAASRSLGMNVRPGQVTNDTIRRATPNNPITVIGSGADYGTHRGNNHFMNVIGTDKTGNAFVSNPMTGRVTRQPIGGIVSSAQMGLYGSGDAADTGGYKFSEAVTAALSRLSSITSNIIEIFTGKSTADQMQSIVDEEKKKEELTQTKLKLGEEGYAEYEQKAWELYQQDNPKKDGEGDPAYQAKYEKVKNDYIIKASREDIATLEKESTNKSYSNILGLSEKMYGKYDAESGEFAGDGFTKEIGESADSVGVNPLFDPNSSINNKSNYSGAGGQFVSDGGAVLGINYDPEFKETDMTSLVNGKYAHSPIHEFIRRMGGESEAWSEQGNFWKLRDNTNSEGQGQNGSTHSGVDIHTSNDDKRDVPLYATTDGTVTGAFGGITRNSGGYSDNGGAGNYVTWVDSAGVKHRYLHMKNSQPMVSVGQKVEGGKTLMGYIGNTGDSYGYHLHYDIGGGMNPMTYFKYVPPTNNLIGGSDPEKIFNYLRMLGYTPNGAAALMGNFRAESNLQPNNLQNSYEYLGSDESYTENVNNGSYSRDKFSHDDAGYGLAQWTYWSRKQGLYDFVDPRNGGNIGDLKSQLDYANQELSSNYAGSGNAAKSNLGIEAITRQIHNEYENPAMNNAEERINFAKEYLAMYGNNAVPTSLDPSLYPTTTVNPVNSPSDARIYESTQALGAGSLVSIAPDATYYTGESIPERILKGNIYVKSIDGNRAILGATEDGYYPDINSPINTKYLSRVGEEVSREISQPHGSYNNTSSNTSKPYGPQPINIDDYVYPQKWDEVANVNNFGFSDSSNIGGTWNRSSNGGGSRQRGSGDISPIQFPTDDFLNQNGDFYDETPNKFITINNVQPASDSKDQIERLNKLLNHTYNVKSASIEKRLDIIIDKLSNEKSAQVIPVQEKKKESLFDDNRIPQQVTRLYK